MLDKGVIGYVRTYFKSKNVTPYDEYIKVEQKELASELECFDKKTLRDWLENRKIPLAIRPTTLLNSLVEGSLIEVVDWDLIVASVKKWYVKRYYQKSTEKDLST